MDELNYSSNALNVLDKFLEVEKVIFVEGVDDETFWDKVIGQFYNHSYEVKSLNGKSNVIEKLNDLRENPNLEFYVAMDYDYSYFNDEIEPHSQLMFTYGYSIENSLIQKNVIKELMKNCGQRNFKEIEDEYNSFENSIIMLINLCLIKDIYCYDNGIESLIGKNISKFCGNRNPEGYKLEEKDITKFSEKITLNEMVENNYQNKLDTSKFKPIDILNGHFLFSMLLKFVIRNSKAFREKLSLSNDGLLLILFSVFDKGFKPNHPHYEYYKNEVNKLNVS